MGRMLNSVLRMVRDRVLPGSETGRGNGGMLGKIGDMLNGSSARTGRNNVRPASEDPYGDPADQQTRARGGVQGGKFGKVKPASEDPYGDPADQ